MKTRSASLFIAGILMILLISFAQGEETEATRLLKARSAEFKQEVIQVTDSVYTAVGYSVQPVSMIIGNTGLIIVDTGMDTISAKQILRDFRKITQKPIQAIILTHSHGDHTGGIPVFAGSVHPPIWARSNFGSEGDPLRAAGLTITRVRGARQGGFKLPPEKRINNGIAQAYWPKRGGAVFQSAEKISPTHTFTEARKRLDIAGVSLDLVAVNGETADALYVWLPEQRVLFSGDNFYKSWPNLYAIRGTMYRDVRAWADAVDSMLQEQANYLVPGHTRPIFGKEKIATMLTDYRDAIRFVFDKTIEGMNRGLTPNELVDYVKLPQRFQGKDYLREYYGNIQWSVRQIFNAHLGWFDGNPTTLFPLNPRAEAQRVADLAGGADVLLQTAKQALANDDAQWAAQLCDYLIALDPQAQAPKLIKADVLEALAENVLSGIGRNYYLTVAQELRASAN